MELRFKITIPCVLFCLAGEWLTLKWGKMHSYWHKTFVYLEWILRRIKIILIIATRGKEDISLSKLNSERLELKAEECELCFASKSSILLEKLWVVFNENTYCAGAIKTFSIKIWKVQTQTNHFPLPESWNTEWLTSCSIYCGVCPYCSDSIPGLRFMLLSIWETLHQLLL